MVLVKEISRDIYEEVKADIERKKLIASSANYSPEKRKEVEKAIAEAEKSLEILKDL